MDQRSKLTLTHNEGIGVLLMVTTGTGKEFPLAATHEHVANLRPGQELTIKAVADERWEKAQAERQERERAAAEGDKGKTDAPADDAPPTSQTLAEGLQAADRAPGAASPVGQGEQAEAASISGLSGASTVDSGATSTTSRPSKK